MRDGDDHFPQCALQTARRAQTVIQVVKPVSSRDGRHRMLLALSF